MHPSSAPGLEVDVRRHALVLSVANDVTFRQDPGDLFRDLGPRLLPTLCFDFLNFALFHPARHIMRCYVWEGAEWPREPQEIALEEFGVGRVWRDQTALLIDDLRTDRRFRFELNELYERKMRSYCLLPLTTSSARLGALGFASKQAHAFNADDVAYMHRLAQMMALCLDQALPHATLLAERDRLLQQAESPTRRLASSDKELIRGAAPPSRSQRGAMAAESDPPEAGNPIWFSAAEALIESEPLLTAYFSASRVGLCILDTDFRYLAVNQTLAEINGIPAEAHLMKTVREVLGNSAELVESQLKRVLATGQPILNREVSFTLPNRSEPGHWTDHFIPIKDANGEITQVGVVVVETTEQKKLEESLRDVSETLQQEKKRQRVLLEVSRALAENWDVRQVFPKVSAYLRRFLRQEYAALSLRDEKSGLLIGQAMDFPLAKNPNVGERIGAAIGPGTKVLQERSSLIFTQHEMQAIDPEIADGLLSEGIKSLCCVPLLRPAGPLGVLVLGSTRADAFKTDDLTLLNQVATLLAIALENARIGLQVEQFKSRLRQERSYLEEPPRMQPHFEEIIGDSPALKQALDQIAIVAPSNASVLILGETGTGKGLVARALHRTSRRREQPFVSLNCAAIPTGLLESELFGHEKGAFTGAVSQKVGRLELADKGTLFLDEIGEIPLEVQPKLLRVLQDHEFERLGGTRTIHVDLRVIAATNRDLEKSVTDKEFRSDLFYRLNVFPLRLPSLRERRGDVPLLVRYFVQKYARRMERNIESILTETIDALLRWHWPGNVRELENFIERSVILTDGTALRAPLEELNTTAPGPISGERSLEDAERECIVRALRQSGGKISGPVGAARQLGLKRSTLQSKMQRLGITRKHYSGPKPD